ncbi:MAG: acyltransferase [Marinilabiliaceae bacterium]|nr:acyltransferase [Marinilabiliaceae bacterium]
MSRFKEIIAYSVLSILFPNFPFKGREYPLKKMIIWGIKQRMPWSEHRKISWPVHPSTQIKAPENIKIGTLAPGLAVNCYIDARNGIELEENVWIGPNVSIISMDHDINNYDQYVKESPIIIQKNSLLTSGCKILPGVVLGEHTIVAAGTVVTKSFPEGNQILAGVPAKIVKTIENYKGQTFPLYR